MHKKMLKSIVTKERALIDIISMYLSRYRLSGFLSRQHQLPVCANTYPDLLLIA